MVIVPGTSRDDWWWKIPTRLSTTADMGPSVVCSVCGNFTVLLFSCLVIWVCDSMDCPAWQAPLSTRMSRQNGVVAISFSGELPDPLSESSSPALSIQILYWVTWEAPTQCNFNKLNIYWMYLMSEGPMGIQRTTELCWGVCFWADISISVYLKKTWVTIFSSNH